MFIGHRRHRPVPDRCMTLTCRNSDASRNADTVVDDSKHIDVILHSSLQAWDGAGGHIAWYPNL